MNIRPIRMALCASVLLLGPGLLTVQPARANDHIFPAAPAARASIDFDSKGFLIDGKRTFIVSAGMEYARVPAALWRDRLLRLKRAGFNCVEMYNFWNWHEPQEGKFDFSGDHDLNAYLKLVHELGMYAICRVGPYYCAEWDQGGYPLWLRFKPGLRVRADDPPFITAVDQFFNHIIPIIAANQINRGGSVILVQLENEGAGWGTDEPNPYFKHIRAKALSLGLQVPYFFSGLHHGGDPGSDKAMDDPNRPNPWFTTEFWSVWYDHYGAGPGDAVEFGRRTWKIIAHGGNGYNYYMAHGGTNFGYTNNNEDAASYDYGAAVGQTGDLRPMYYTFKRCALFARSFQDILEDSTDGTDEVKGSATGGVHVTERKSPSGSILFLDNPGGRETQTQLSPPPGAAFPAAGPFTLAPHEIMPIVRDFPVLPGVMLQWAPTRILGLAAQGDTTTLVAYGPPGSTAELRFTAPSDAHITGGAASLAAEGPGSLVFKAAIPTDAPVEASFTVGAKRIRVLAMSRALADRTWFVDTPAGTDVVCGPAYVGDATVEGGRPRLTTELPWLGTHALPTLVYPPAGPTLRMAAPAAPAHPANPKLTPWQVKDASEPALPRFDDHTWLASAVPLQMGADGDLTADAWYRASITVPTAGKYEFNANGGGRATLFVDGNPVGTGKIRSDIPVELPAGQHTLAVFTAHDGRDKLFGYVGPLDTKDPKGLDGPVTIMSGSGTGTALTGWRVMKAGPGGAKAGPPAADAPGWHDYTIGDDAFNQQSGFAWFRTTLPASEGARMASLRFESVDDNGTVFVDGKQIATHEGWDQAFSVPVTPGPERVLTVLVENTGNTGGLDKPVLFSTRTGAPVATADWSLHGGPGDPLSADGWKPLKVGETFPGPTFFRASFAAAPPRADGSHPILRVISTGLGHGSVWVNGHNLGRYPEKIFPIDGLYIPECWLIAGQNSVVIYDEDGKRPDGVMVAAEVGASRDVSVLAAALGH